MLYRNSLTDDNIQIIYHIHSLTYIYIMHWEYNDEHRRQKLMLPMGLHFSGREGRKLNDKLYIPVHVDMCLNV